MITIDSDPKLNPINIGAFILNAMATYDYTEIEIESLFEALSTSIPTTHQGKINYD